MGSDALPRSQIVVMQRLPCRRPVFAVVAKASAAAGGGGGAATAAAATTDGSASFAFGTVLVAAHPFVVLGTRVASRRFSFHPLCRYRRFCFRSPTRFHTVGANVDFRGTPWVRIMRHTSPYW